MKTKWLWILTALCLCFVLPAMAQPTALPFGLAFDMPTQQVQDALAAYEMDVALDNGAGIITLQDCAGALDGVDALWAEVEMTRNNSAGVPGLSHVYLHLSVEGGAIASFRAALEALTALYGQPDYDPFDANGVAGYVEYGTLSATWTTEDTRISLNMYRMYEESLGLSFADRLCYDAADLGL